MKAGEKLLLQQFINGSIRNFVIPIYQRNYDWNVNQCSVLFDDILEIIEIQKNHFFGVIVSTCESTNRIIIDGQQRLTTVNLILLAIYRIILDNIKNSNINNEELTKLKTIILEEYLINRFEENEERLKLKLAKNNKNDFSDLFNEKIPIDFIKRKRSENRIYENFIFFYDKIQENIKNSNNNIETFFDSLKKLIIVDIELEPAHGDNPQLIFETLNSTGKKLEQSDLIRNYLLMNLNEKQQEAYYSNFWMKIEENSCGNIHNFFEFFLSYIKNKTIKKDDIYCEFKKFLENKKINKEEIFETILCYSKYYRDIIKYQIAGQHKEINQSLKNILGGEFLEHFVVIPFVFYLLNKFEEKLLSIEDLSKIILTLESFLFRRLIVGESTARLKGLFITLGKNIDVKSGDIFTNFICYLNENDFPNDNLFIDRFITNRVYERKNAASFIKNILLEVEKNKYNLKEYVNNDEITIEHIVPQTITIEWKKYLNDDVDLIQNEFIHTIGNLTITGYNSEISNKTFENKKEIYKTSNIALTRNLCGYKDFKLQEIKDRSREIATIATSIWKYYNFQENNNSSLESFTLAYYNDNNIDLTYPKIDYFTFNNEKYSIGENWIENYMKIIELLCELDNNLFYEKIVNNTKFSTIISTSNNSFRMCKEIKFYLFIEGNFSTDAKIQNIIKIVENLDLEAINLDSIEIFLKKVS